MVRNAATQVLLAPFSDPQAVARYREGPPRFVPGFNDLHRMAGLLLTEHVSDDARMLVLGAGGGLELTALAEHCFGWTFTGVDPSAEMLKLARQTLGAHAPRAQLIEGYIDAAPDGPFDAAVCLLTLHFLSRDERVRTLKQVHRRLKPGAPFVVAHSSFPQAGKDRSRWLNRYASFAVHSGADPAQVGNMKSAVEAHLHLFSPDQDEDMLREAGFCDVQLFYAAFTWRGWLAHA